jgi:type IV pilus assembly protein PilF
MKNWIKWISILSLLWLIGGCATKKKPESPEDNPALINLQLGMGYMQSGSFEVAEEKLQKALEFDDSMPEVHNAIAVLYEETGKDDLAGKHYRRALSLKSDFAVARVNYGRFLCDKGRYREGEAQYLKAAENPDYPSPEVAYVGASVCAMSIPDPDRAEVHLQQALAARPNAVRPLYQMADIGYARGQYREARDYLRRFHAKADYSPESLWLAISIENALGNRQQRQVYVNMLRSKFADSEQARRVQ